MSRRRVLALMGSGETSPTMVKTHRSLSSADVIGAGGAVLLDTPFGFQSNADELTMRARQYFAESVGVPLAVASYRSVDEVGSASYEAAMAAVRSAGYVFAGPGSPTYALTAWRASAVPALLEEKVVSGGVVTFASAAALTVGAVTVPVYEIYKVGAEPAWVEGLGLLEAACGLRAAVIPHFNNAEGGTHDTRYCYLGESRLRLMERSLPEGAFVLGVDEHTGLVLDVDAGTASVVGVGGVTIRSGGGASVRVIPSGSVCSIDDLRPSSSSSSAAGSLAAAPVSATPGAAAAAVLPGGESPLLATVRAAESAFDAALESRDVEAAVQVVLDVEADLRAWSTETFSSDEFDRARGALRGMIVRLGSAAVEGVRDPRSVVGPFVDVLLSVRDTARAERRWSDADLVRDALIALGVEVRDSASGASAWELKSG